MKFIKGFIIGTLVGISVGTAISEQQRKEIVARVRDRAAPVGDAVKNNVSDIADSVTDQATDAVDKVGLSVVDSIESDESKAPSTSAPSTPGGPPTTTSL